MKEMSLFLACFETLSILKHFMITFRANKENLEHFTMIKTHILWPMPNSKQFQFFNNLLQEKICKEIK